MTRRAGWTARLITTIAVIVALTADQRQLFLPVAEDAIGRFVDPPRVV